MSAWFKPRLQRNSRPRQTILYFASVFVGTLNPQKVRYWVYRAMALGHSKAYGKAANKGYAGRVAELLEDGASIGQLQFEFHKRRGLEPQHRLLDVGCAYLRGGQYFIDYLEPGHYVGMDISGVGFRAAKDHLDKRLFTANWPGLIQNDDLRFEEFHPDTFDFAIAQSLFTHLRAAEIEECLGNIGRVLKPDGTFFATYFDTADDPSTSSTVFAYSGGFFESVCAKNGLQVEFVPKSNYDHPVGQRMMAIRNA